MSLELILGCMFSGKSTELIRRVRRYQSIGKKVCVINHNADTRTGDKVETHYGDTVKALKCVHLSNFMNSGTFTAFEVICIDEAQFFGDLYDMVMSMVDLYGLHVIVAGLSGDFQRNHFGEIHRLIPKADDIHFCKAYCGMCKDMNKPAVFTMRLSKSVELVEVGASDKYVAVCRKCYLK